MNGYPVAVEALHLEVCELAALVAGGKASCDFERDYPGLRLARATFERSEVSRRLVSLAILVRQGLEGADELSAPIVGVLTPDTSNPEYRCALSLETCNKIIHADTPRLSSEPIEQDRTPPVSHTIVLVGKHNEKDWRAELNVLAFLSVAFSRF